jgi:hypothetical protein
MKNTNERLYWFYILDGRNGKDSEGEQMLRPFIQGGHKIENLYIFQSQASIEDIHKFIKENKLKDFMYMLVDMTDNVTSETFKCIVNEDHYRPAAKLIQLLNQYKPEKQSDIKEEKFDPKELEIRVNNLLDKMSKKGPESLTPQQKTFLQEYSQGKYDKKN